jgi:sulfate adenylyltransferase
LDTKTSKLISPYGGKLINLIAAGEEIEHLTDVARGLPSLQLTQRSVCDLELLATGAFSPLDRFLGRADYACVLDEARLTTGLVFPIPVTLSVEPGPASRPGQEIALCDETNCLLAIMTVEEVYEWDRAHLARRVFGTEDARHPLVAEMHRWGRLNISGRLRVLGLPRHYDFRELRLTPAQTRARLETLGHANVVAFQTRNPLHRVHEEMTKRAISEVDGALLLHPVVGMTKPGDVDHYTRVRTYRAVSTKYYDQDRILLALLPLAMRMAGPREALWHAVIRRNYGANHMIVGRDHAGPGVDSAGKPFYGPFEARELVERFTDEIGVGVVPFQEMVYLPETDRYEEVSMISDRTRAVSLSGTRVRDDFNRGETPPAWVVRPEVTEILAETHPPRHRQGVCVWLTGLSGSGKSSAAEVLTELLLEHGRRVTVLDGDVVRAHLSRGLGFSRDDRDANVRRIGFVAAELVRHGGAVVCAAVSPYRATRNDVRNMVGADNFVEVFVDTPIEVCEKRDAKGLYARARRGEIKGFTGINDPYESPLGPEVTVDASTNTPEENARLILSYLIEEGFVRAAKPSHGQEG